MLAGLGFVFGTECPIIDETLLPLLFLRRPLVSKADLNLSNDLELLVLLHPPKGWDYRHAHAWDMQWWGWMPALHAWVSTSS